jgi:cyclase
VIDAHINGAMAGMIQAAVRQVTNKPILYVVNTNYHGDHTFGNSAFPQETVIVAQQKAAEIMRDFEREKQLLLPYVDHDRTVFDDVRLRLPDLVVKEYLELDLGGRVVELYHFGHGNTPGDTVVYVPEARVACTGNLIVGEGTSFSDRRWGRRIPGDDRKVHAHARGGDNRSRARVADFGADAEP